MKISQEFIIKLLLVTYLLTDYIELSFNFIENELETISERLIPKSLVIYFLNSCNSISKDVCLVPRRFLFPEAMFLIEIWGNVSCAFLWEVGLEKKHNTTTTKKLKQKIYTPNSGTLAGNFQSEY